MITKRLWIFLILSCFILHGEGHSYVNDRMRTLIKPHLLPADHPMKHKIDAIFSQTRATEDINALINAGFELIEGSMPFSFITVARHPEVPGYVFKLYLDSEKRCRRQVPHWVWLLRRCNHASRIRTVIKTNRIRYFTVPDKWLYVLPDYPYSRELDPEPMILIATDMKPVSPNETLLMWRTVNEKYLDELFTILAAGCGTAFLHPNVPYTKNGKFTFIDTEDQTYLGDLHQVKKFLPKKMRRYWSKKMKEVVNKKEINRIEG